MVELNLQLFGGRGGGSGMGAGGGNITNNVGASREAVSLLEQAVLDIKRFGSAHIPIGHTTNEGANPRASNPANKDLEKQLKSLGEENDLLVAFDTKTSSRITYDRERVDGSRTVYKMQTKERMMHVYRK